MTLSGEENGELLLGDSNGCKDDEENSVNFGLWWKKASYIQARHIIYKARHWWICNSVKKTPSMGRVLY